jgi:hypothetical protein
MSVRGLLITGASALAIGLGVLFAVRGTPLARRLGPADGFDLPPTDLERVAVGDVAPDFSLRSLSGDTHTLSEYRGAKNVVLVFYRGHW